MLNVIALFSIVILYLRQNRLLQVEKKQEKLLKEMEEVISTYLIEMTEENEKFIEKVRESVSKPVNKEKNTLVKVEHEAQTPSEMDEKIEDKLIENPPFRKGTVYQAVQAYKNTGSLNKIETEEIVIEDTSSVNNSQLETIQDESEATNDLYTQSFYYQALLLKKQGLSTEDIARRLNKGKTEIELLLKLRQNQKE